MRLRGIASISQSIVFRALNLEPHLARGLGLDLVDPGLLPLLHLGRRALDIEPRLENVGLHERPFLEPGAKCLHERGWNAGALFHQFVHLLAAVGHKDVPWLAPLLRRQRQLDSNVARKLAEFDR